MFHSVSRLFLRLTNRPLTNHPLTNRPLTNRPLTNDRPLTKRPYTNCVLSTHVGCSQAEVLLAPQKTFLSTYNMSETSKCFGVIAVRNGLRTKLME